MTQEPKIFPYIAKLLNDEKVQYKTLGEVCDKIFAGGTPTSTKEEYYNGTIPWLRSGEINFNEIDKTEKTITELGFSKSSARWVRKNSVLLAMTGATVARSAVNNIKLTANQSVCALETNESIINYKYLYYCLANKYEALKNQGQGVLSSLNLTTIKKIPIPLPPLSVQQEIVRILDKFTTLEAELEAELDCRKRQYEYYRDTLLSYEGNEVEWKTLDQISENLDSKRQPITSGLRTSGKIPYYGASGIVDYVEDYIFDGDFLLISEDGANLLARNTPIAFSVSGKIWVNNHAHILKFRTYEERRFIEFYLNKTDLTPYISGAAQPKLNKKNLNSIKFPLPPLEEQQRIVGILDKFDTLVNSISEGLPREIELRKKQYEYYREQLLSFPSSLRATPSSSLRAEGEAIQTSKADSEAPRQTKTDALP